MNIENIGFDTALMLAQYLRDESVAQDVFFFMEELAMKPVDALHQVSIKDSEITSLDNHIF